MAAEVSLLVLMVIIFIIIFLICRRIVWWYFGIDKHLENQRTIVELLKAQIELEQTIENQAARRRMEHK